MPESTLAKQSPRRTITEFYEELSSISDIIQKVAEQQAEMKASQGVFVARFDEVVDQVAELHRTVRGYNGTDGLVARLVRIETVLAQKEGGAKTAPALSVPIPADDQSVKWKDVLNGLKPVIYGFIMYFLFDLLPKLIGMSQQGTP